VTGLAADPGVRFVVVPFVPAQQPALGVSSLLAVLKRAGIGGDVRYLNLAYGERVGWKFYNYLIDMLPTHFLPGDMVFSRALWGDRAPDLATYEERVVEWIRQAAAGGEAGLRAMLAEWERQAELVRAAFEEAPRIVSGWADELLADQPRVLGFTTTFQQNAAALALAQEVRRRVSREEVAILFGGANCEGDMGRALADNFPFIDAVVSGEAENVIVDLARRFIDAPGSAGQGSGPESERGGIDAPGARYVPGVMVSDMDALPRPNFDQYFAAAERTQLRDKTWLTAESSRGCWWGMKSHCTFCGLNGGTMKFRSKSAARFAEELDSLQQSYGVHGFALTDNILDMQYLRSLLPDLVAKARQYRLFYETKSNLRKDQVEMLAAAGVAWLQPGIESFSTPVLKLMAKGTTRLQNVQLLKWCAELGVTARWNVIYGFPGEDPREYDEMADLLPSLFHLQPPSGSTLVRLDRFSPYWEAPERHGMVGVRHTWAYDYVFSGLAEAERGRLAYFFDYEYADGRRPVEYARTTALRVSEWVELARTSKPRLELRVSADGAIIVDTRPCRREELFAVGPVELAVLRALDGYRALAAVPAALREARIEITARACDAILAELIDRRFVLEENGYGLSVILDPRERQRVAERQVALRADRFGFRWPDDFPDPAKRQIVRSAMLALAPEPCAPSPR
jgi:ribosomal peptide maturation radical SAM protein 1